MKKIIFILITLSSLINADVLDNLIPEEKKEFFYNDKFYPIDKTCSRLDLKKLLLITSKQLLSQKIKSFYLDLCPPFKSIYNLNQADIDHNSKINVGDGFKYLVQDNPNSFYVHLFAYIYSKKYKFNLDINHNLFKDRSDDFSKYIRLNLERRVLHDKAFSFPEDYYLKVYRDGQSLLKSQFNIVYLAIYRDLQIYYKNNLENEYSDFLKKIIKENSKRMLSNQLLYVDLADFEFNRDYLDLNVLNKSEIANYLKKSYKFGFLKSQKVLFEKLNIIDDYLLVTKDYPKYMSDIVEYNLLKKNMKKIEEYKLYVYPNYYYLAKYTAFIYEKLIYIKNDKQITGTLIKSLQGILLNEKDPKKIRKIKRKITDLVDNKFFK